jgi:hypothetical protein
MKNIVSRISVTPQTLENLAQKIAYYLHSRNKREETFQTLQLDIRRITMNEMDAKLALTALDELIDPCNLLIPMSDDGKFGFGHLRYQEHLAAKELLANRGIDVLPLLKQSWWKGVLLLFARMNSNLEWLVRAVGDVFQISNYEVLLTEMIATRPKSEQLSLEHLYKNYQLLEHGGLKEDRADFFGETFDDY